MDALSELAYDFAPYRYGFNNPVFWSDASGLFETEAAARYYQLSHGLFGSSIEYDTDNGSWSINTGKSMITQIGDWILTTYELDGGGGGADWSKAGGSGSKDNSQSKKSDDGFWKFWERGGGFNVWGVMKDDPGFKPNSRKRGAVFASVNYDEAYERGKTSMMAGANWWKRYKDFLGGLDSRNSTLGERLNKTETKDVEKEQLYYYNTWDPVHPLYNYNLLILMRVERDTSMTPTKYHNTNWNQKAIYDSIQSIELIKNKEKKQNR